MKLAAITVIAGMSLVAAKHPQAENYSSSSCRYVDMSLSQNNGNALNVVVNTIEDVWKNLDISASKSNQPTVTRQLTSGDRFHLVDSVLNYCKNNPAKNITDASKFVYDEQKKDVNYAKKPF